jgi:hypothetical protein
LSKKLTDLMKNVPAKKSFDLDSAVVKYHELNEQSKGLKKQLDPINKDIKAYMKEERLSKYEAGDIKVAFSVQERTTMNEDALVEKLKALGLTEAIKTVEKPNEEVIEHLLYEGKLAASELESCVEKKFIEVLKVSGGKK